jgi:hypothetical protein
MHTVSSSQLIHLGIIIAVKVIAQAVGGLSQQNLLRNMNAMNLPARKATRAAPKTSFLAMVAVSKSNRQRTKAAPGGQSEVPK